MNNETPCQGPLHFWNKIRSMMELSTILPKELPRSLSIHITCLVKSPFPVVNPHIHVNYHSVTIGNNHIVHINDNIMWMYGI